MKKLFVIALLLLSSGCAPVEQPVEEALTDWEPVKTAHVENYFTKLKPDTYHACTNELEEQVWDNRIGVNSWPVSQVHTATYFEWVHDGEYLLVDFYCDFDVTYRANAFNYPTEEILHHVGQFRMKKYYNPETKRLTALGFE